MRSIINSGQTMLYRNNRRTGDRISIIGMGSSSIGTSTEEEIERIISTAIEQGINYFDLAAADATPFAPYGRAFSGCRHNVLLQVHFGADYKTGTYGWTTDLDEVRRSVAWQLEQLRTDYIDYGFIHCIDEESDLRTVMDNGIIDHILDLRRQGIVRHIGLSSHTPSTVQKILDMGIVDMLMFSINPGYDYSHGEYAKGSGDERAALYRRCEAEGIGISVMKPFSAGQLLDAATSPFGKALTRYQCIQYALDKPGVLTVLPGVRNMEDLQDILGFCDSTEAERDWSVLGELTPGQAQGICVYCNHCQPCPMGLNVGLINKYYDLAKAGDTLAEGHYRKLETKASACISCGHCDRRCPFHVDQSGRMQTIASYFGE